MNEEDTVHSFVSQYFSSYPNFFSTLLHLERIDIYKIPTQTCVARVQAPETRFARQFIDLRLAF